MIVQKLANVAHHAILLPTAFFTYAMAGLDPLAAGVIALGGVGLWLHAHLHTHPQAPSAPSTPLAASLPPRG